MCLQEEQKEVVKKTYVDVRPRSPEPSSSTLRDYTVALITRIHFKTLSSACVATWPADRCARQGYAGLVFKEEFNFDRYHTLAMDIKTDGNAYYFNVLPGTATLQSATLHCLFLHYPAPPPAPHTHTRLTPPTR